MLFQRNLVGYPLLGFRVSHFSTIMLYLTGQGALCLDQKRYSKQVYISRTSAESNFSSPNPIVNEILSN